MPVMSYVQSNFMKLRGILTNHKIWAKLSMSSLYVKMQIIHKTLETVYRNTLTSTGKLWPLLLGYNVSNVIFSLNIQKYVLIKEESESFLLSCKCKVIETVIKIICLS